MNPDNQKSNYSFANKWSENIECFGFTTVPILLLLLSERMGISNAQLITLLCIDSFRWKRGDKPFAKLETLSQLAHVSEHTVTLHTTALAKRKLIKKSRRKGTSNSYDLEPLVMALDEAAKRFLNAPIEKLPKILQKRVINYRTKMYDKEDSQKKDIPQKRHLGHLRREYPELFEEEEAFREYRPP